MALSIISNQAASIAARQLGQANDAATSTAEKLSSGKRVNSAADDAAASAIAARLSAEIAGLQTASVNAGQASSLLQIADGAFQNVEDILTRAKSLAVQAGSEQISDTERGFLDQEFQALKSEIDRIANDTEFNGTKLVNGDVTAAVGTATTTNFGGVSLMTTGGGSAMLLTTNANPTPMGIMNTMITPGLQTLDVMNVNLVTSFTQKTNTAATTVTNNFTGAQLGTLMLDTNGAVTAMVEVVTNGGGTANATFTGQLQTQDGMNITMAADVTDNAAAVLMAGTMTAGTITLNVGTGLTALASTTATNGVLFQGQEVMNFNFKVGTGTNATEDEISVGIGGITTTALGISNSNILTQANADLASAAVSDAIDALQAKRSDVGAAQNRLDFASQNVALARENQEAARSELEDLNVARAITEFSQQQLLVQAGTSTLSQANNLPQNLLQLFN